jgi:copper(I)-binding protein
MKAIVKPVMNLKSRTTLLLTILCLSTCFFKPVYANDSSLTLGNLTVENAWIAEAPPVSRVMVAYMVLNNTGSEAIEIIHAESDLYSSIEFHETRHENDVARMIRHDSLYLPANNKLELRRNGPHLMLFNPTKRLKAGDTVNIKLTAKNNASKTILVTVKKTPF